MLCSLNIIVIKFPGITRLFSLTFETCYWLIILVTMTTPISSHVKDKNSMFTACDEDIFLVIGKIMVFHQYLYIISFSRKLVIVLTKAAPAFFL